MKKLILGALLIGNAYGATIKIEATTNTGFGAWFMPTNINTSAQTIIEKGVTCLNLIKDGTFQLVCQRDGNKFLIYKDKTPQKDAIIATPDIVVKITTMEK